MEPFRCAEQGPPITGGSRPPWKWSWYNLSTGEPSPDAPSASPICNLFKQLCQRHGFKFGYKERREIKMFLVQTKTSFSSSLGPCLITKPLPPILVLRFSRGAGNQHLSLQCLCDMGVE